MTHSIKELNSVLKELETRGFSLSELVTIDAFNYFVDVSKDYDESLEDVINNWLDEHYDDAYVDQNLLKSLVNTKL